MIEEMTGRKGERRKERESKKEKKGGKRKEMRNDRVDTNRLIKRIEISKMNLQKGHQKMSGTTIHKKAEDTAKTTTAPKSNGQKSAQYSLETRC
jgi:hypothetical protein